MFQATVNVSDPMGRNEQGGIERSALTAGYSPIVEITDAHGNVLLAPKRDSRSSAAAETLKGIPNKSMTTSESTRWIQNALNGKPASR